MLEQHSPCMLQFWQPLCNWLQQWCCQCVQQTARTYARQRGEQANGCTPCSALAHLHEPDHQYRQPSLQPRHTDAGNGLEDEEGFLEAGACAFLYSVQELAYFQDSIGICALSWFQS